MARAAAIALASIVAATNAAPAQHVVPEPEDYRLDNYRAPTPETLSGARVLETDEAERLWREGEAIFIDVMPRPPKPANLPEGTIWRDPPRRNIPGSAWLINVGFGQLDEITEHYFRSALAELADEPDRLLVFYCLAECWMSWNAAKRALELGYSNVAWFPDGTDGWQAAGLPLQDAVPVPGPGR